MSTISKTFSDEFNNASNEEKPHAVKAIMDLAPVEIRKRIFVVIVEKCLWARW